MKKILFLITLIPIVFIGSSCSSGGGGDDTSCDDCDKDSIMGQWELQSETIEFSGCPVDYEDEDNEFPSDTHFFIFDLDGNFVYHSGLPDDISECSGIYDLDEDCEAEANFDQSGCIHLDNVVGLLESSNGGPLTICSDDDGGFIAVGEFDMHALGYPDAQEGCVLIWTGEFRED